MIMRILYETNSALTIETKYDGVKNFESDVGETELGKIHSVRLDAITDVRKQKRDIENYLKRVATI